MTEQVNHAKCGRCKCWRVTPAMFLNEKGRLMKTCGECRRNKHKCDQCDKDFSRKGDLNTHVKAVHDKIKDVECPECESKFSRKGDLKQHIKAVHDKIKGFECEQCDFKCCSNGDLKRHIKQIHDKIKDFGCPQCEFACSDNSNINRHIKAVHDKIKDVECPDCDLKFSQKSTLYRHIKRIHDKIKDHKCPDCEYKCSSNNDVKKHQKYHCNKGITSNKSTGELKVQSVLEKYEIDYVFDGSHNNLRSYEDKGVLRFDFCLPTEDNSFVFIEFDGRQHERPTQFGSQTSEEGLEQFNRQQQNDRIKNEYCKDKNYPLLRIRYNNTKIEETILQFFEDNDVEYN